MDGVGAGEPILRISDPASLFLVGESATKGGDSPTTLVDQSASSADCLRDMARKMSSGHR